MHDPRQAQASKCFSKLAVRSADFLDIHQISPRCEHVGCVNRSSAEARPKRPELIVDSDMAREIRQRPAGCGVIPLLFSPASGLGRRPADQWLCGKGCVDDHVSWIMSHLVAIPSRVSDSFPLAVMNTASSKSCTVNSPFTSSTSTPRGTKW